MFNISFDSNFSRLNRSIKNIFDYLKICLIIKITNKRDSCKSICNFDTFKN
jgi:hypothetical protein